jgi:hypothetical protein
VVSTCVECGSDLLYINLYIAIYMSESSELLCRELLAKTPPAELTERFYKCVLGVRGGEGRGEEGGYFIRGTGRVPNTPT